MEIPNTVYTDINSISTSEQRPLSVPSLAKQVEFSFFPQVQAQIEDTTLPPYKGKTFSLDAEDEGGVQYTMSTFLICLKMF